MCVYEEGSISKSKFKDLTTNRCPRIPCQGSAAAPEYRRLRSRLTAKIRDQTTVAGSNYTLGTKLQTLAPYFLSVSTRIMRFLGAASVWCRTAPRMLKMRTTISNIEIMSIFSLRVLGRRLHSPASALHGATLQLNAVDQTLRHRRLQQKKEYPSSRDRVLAASTTANFWILKFNK